MKKIGLALSGGGFRASLYHLGLVRFLRDAKILPNVTHITSVSGGSIFAAHLALNWGRYNGSDSEFDCGSVRAAGLRSPRRSQSDHAALSAGLRVALAAQACWGSRIAS